MHGCMGRYNIITKILFFFLGMTEEWKQRIINSHNYRRSQVEPPASNMLKMVRYANVSITVENLILHYYSF